MPLLSLSKLILTQKDKRFFTSDKNFFFKSNFVTFYGVGQFLGGSKNFGILGGPKFWYFGESTICGASLTERCACANIFKHFQTSLDISTHLQISLSLLSLLSTIILKISSIFAIYYLYTSPC